MQVIHEKGRAPIKAWIEGVELEDEARQQLRNVAALPFIHQHIAVMPDCHWGMGATVGSVIPTVGAIMPAAVGVDIGCGMMARATTLRAGDLPDDSPALRAAIERAVPHRAHRASGGSGTSRGAWHGMPAAVAAAWTRHGRRATRDDRRPKHPKIASGLTAEQLGTLGTGNHFIEVCLDERDAVWVMLHSGSRGVGNRIGTYFIERAKEEMRRVARQPARRRTSPTCRRARPHFDDYVAAVGWAQDFARTNRALMMERVLAVLREHLPAVRARRTRRSNCHHNYVAARAPLRQGRLGDAQGRGARARAATSASSPASMGARARTSCAARATPRASTRARTAPAGAMSRSEAKRRFTRRRPRARDRRHRVPQGRRRDRRDAVAYKDIDAVMAAQRDLVEVVHTLRAVVCVKG